MADLTKIRLSGVTYDLTDSNALHTLDQNVTSGGTNAVQGSGIYNAITASSEAILTTVANAGYQTSGDVQSAISGKADATAVTEEISAAVSGKVNTSTFNTYTGTTVPNLLADKADASALTAYFGAVNYDSNTKRINFYNENTGGTVLAYVDATDFIKDGMVDNVEIKTVSGETVLAITFNADAGKEEIDIPLTNIFNPNNYYDKTAIDTALSGKQDTLIEGSGIEIDAENNIKAVYTIDTIDYGSAGSLEMFEDLLENISAEQEFWVVPMFSEDEMGSDGVQLTITVEEGNEFHILFDVVSDFWEVSEEGWEDYFTISHNGSFYTITALQALDSVSVDANAKLVGDSSYIVDNPTTTKAALDYIVSEVLKLKIIKQNNLTAGNGISISGDVISVTGAPLTMDDTVTSGSSNPVKSSGIYSAITAATSVKQDTLVSGTNIKTVGNESVLGSGNIPLMTAYVGTGADAETLIIDFV